MKKYLVKTPTIVKLIFNKWDWSFSKNDKSIYLTFDDGPTPEITDWVLTELKKVNAKATFFCIGKNIKQHPSIFNKIALEGHSIGNHTNNHLKATKTKESEYLQNVLLAENEIHKYLKTDSQNFKLFRPPYGKLSLRTGKKLRKKGFKIIMWDVLSADFDTEISKEKCLRNVIKNTENGSVIVFHDSVKASEKVKFVLPQILDYYTAKGYLFKAIA
ncbi:polysaccharide deacetylase family protein [Lutibacter sp. TH_r2]|uniref:polysaccharide deacetylase family protein n=1 Tax=Lutibacter sp. TH_r2 TaxID=3082083 RepID=UPI002952C511|nr:polysaccharide deacetylase family protein [Lutibacter sp. TH_r2]MDV7186149.1 polysaccharide deacetylase family protein [Lutibacter sp. TH_r2]